MGERFLSVPGRPFYDRPPLDVARDLLGAQLHHGGIAVRLTEVEAYGGGGDPASHAFRGPTPRCAAMFGPPGHAYVYLIYGIHWCMNVVCGPAGEAAAVLLRAGESCAGGPCAGDPVEGVDAAVRRRVRPASTDFARGPARLTRTLGIDGSLDGTDLTGEDGALFLAAGVGIADARVARGPRVGVGAAHDRPWRLWIVGERSVSAYRPGRRRAVPRVAAPDPGCGSGTAGDPVRRGIRYGGGSSHIRQRRQGGF